MVSQHLLTEARGEHELGGPFCNFLVRRGPHLPSKNLIWLSLLTHLLLSCGFL